MPLALAFDYGTARIGVASGQTLTQTASPQGALKARDGIPNWEAIKALLDEWRPDVVVVGLPLHADGTESDLAVRARKFGQRLHGRFGVQVEYINEFETTRMAREQMNYRGKASAQDGALDACAACMILERWLGASQ